MKKFLPSLADLSQDIFGDLPVNLILPWNEGDKSSLLHDTLLEPYTVQGIIVCSDSAGLSKMSQEYSLPQVMKLVSEPKEALFAFAQELGAEPIGIWAADNTQLFFPMSSADEVAMMLMAFQNYAQQLKVRVGIGMHVGTVYKLGGGLFGADASYIEELAENHTKGGDILLTPALYTQLSPKVQAYCKPTEDGQNYLLQQQSSTNEHNAPQTSAMYPIPFDVSFYNLLQTSTLEELEQADMSSYCHEKTTVLISIHHEPQEFLLDYFTSCLMAEAIIAKIPGYTKDTCIKCNGALGIFVFDADEDAIQFALETQTSLKNEGFNAHIGVSRGDVFLFPLAQGNQEIAGNPVNIASKLAEDSGMEGICIHDTVHVSDQTPSSPFSLTCSGVALSGISLQP